MSELGLIRLQAAAGAVFLVFVVIHLANTMAAAVGMEAYNELQRSARAFYQNPFVDRGLGAATAHSPERDGLAVVPSRAALEGEVSALTSPHRYGNLLA